MRIIFLDVDGVLNNNETTDRYCGWIGIDPALVDKLKELYEESNKEEETRIVISSSWRYDKIRKDHKADGSYDYLIDRLKEAGMEVIGMTPMNPISGWHRGAEILQWLIENRVYNKVTTFVILDDELFEFSGEDIRLGRNVVKTNGIKGLTDKDNIRALKILRGEEVIPVEEDYYGTVDE